MLTKKLMYHFASLDKMSKRIDEIKYELDNETNFDNKLKLFDEVDTIVNVLVHRYKNNNDVARFTVEQFTQLIK